MPGLTATDRLTEREIRDERAADAARFDRQIAANLPDALALARVVLALLDPDLAESCEDVGDALGHVEGMSEAAFDNLASAEGCGGYDYPSCVDLAERLADLDNRADLTCTRDDRGGLAPLYAAWRAGLLPVEPERDGRYLAWSGLGSEVSIRRALGVA